MLNQESDKVSEEKKVNSTNMEEEKSLETLKKSSQDDIKPEKTELDEEKENMTKENSQNLDNNLKDTNLHDEKHNVQETDSIEIEKDHNDQEDSDMNDLDTETKQKILDNFKKKKIMQSKRKILIFKILLYCSFFMTIISVLYLLAYIATLKDNSEYVAKFNEILQDEKGDERFIGNSTNHFHIVDFRPEKKELNVCDVDRLFILDTEMVFILDKKLSEKERNKVLESLDRRIPQMKKIQDLPGVVEGRTEVFPDFKPNFLVKLGIFLRIPTQRKSIDSLFCQLLPPSHVDKNLGDIVYMTYWCSDQQIYIFKRYMKDQTRPFLSAKNVTVPVDSTLFFSAIMKQCGN